MATYGLKYSQYLEQGGVRLQIKVYVKDYSGASYGMAHITGASLQIVGGQSDVLSPMLKTAFSWSMADCWDEGTTRADGTTCVDATGQKCGKWEEFYTNDATKFKVELSVIPEGGTAAVIWTGFVTQDSWSESLVYRGVVTITARDMLGALKDAEFNLTGRVSVLDIVQGALSACACQMGLSYTAGHFLVNSNGSSILDHTFAASTFSGDNWQTVLEETLESLGLVLRYNGENGIVLASYRYINADTILGTHNCEFISRSGLRSLNPALKEITEIFDIKAVEVATPDPAAGQYTATGNNLTQRIVAYLPGGGTQTSTNYIPGYSLALSGDEGWAGTLGIPAVGTPKDGAADRGIYFPTDIQESVEASLTLPRMRGYFAFKIEQDGGLVEIAGQAGALVIRPCTSGHTISEVRVRVEAVVGGVTKYLTAQGDWTTSSTEFGVGIGTEVVVPDSGAVGARIFIVKVVTENTMPAYFSILAALRLAISPGSEGASFISEYKTTTIYNEENNPTIERTPKVGSATIGGCVDFYENVLALGDEIAPDEWNWPGASSYLPLAVMIQAQVLVYFAAAASVFTGTMHDKTAGRAAALPGYGISYYNRDCLPVNATYDFVSGFVGQVTLREVYSWEQVWGSSFSPQYTRRSGSGKGSTSATGSGGSSVTPGGGATPGGGGATYWEPDGTLAAMIRPKSAYDYVGAKNGLFFAGASMSGTPEPDLYVKVVGEGANQQRVLYSPLALITAGDQIIGDGTPGSGGGGGGASYIYELKDTLSSWIGRPSASETQVLVFDPSANVHDKNGNNGAWKYVNASSIGGVTSVVGQTGVVTVAQIATALTSAGYKLTDHEYSNGYGLNLSNGEFSLTQTVRDSLGLANTALQAASIKTLTLKVGTTTIGSAYNPIGSSNQTLTIAESNLTALLNDNYHPLYGEHDASAEKYFWIGGAKFVWHPAVGGTDGYLELQSAIVTVGDQIVNSGTPGGGGGGGGAGFLYELGDVLTDSDHTVVKQYNGTDNAANNNLFAFNGSKWYALKLGSNLAISSGTLNATDTTYSNGTGLALSNGVFSITSAYQTKIDNGASAYSTLTTSQTKNKVLASPSNASGAPSFRALVAADLPSIENLTNFSTRVYDATTSRTANYVLAAPNGSNGAATFRKLVAADIPSLSWNKITSDKPTTLSGYGITDALPLAGGTMTGSIKLTNGTYINAASGYAMCGVGSDGETFYCGPGAEITSAFYIRSGNINLTHVKAGTNYTIWDASNSNKSDVNWTAQNLTARYAHLGNGSSIVNLELFGSASGAAIGFYKSGTRVSLLYSDGDAPFKRYNGDWSTGYTMYDSGNSNLSTVDWAANNLTAAGIGTFDRVVLSNSGAVSHIEFTRAGWNYISVPTDGVIAFNTGGSGSANTSMAVTPDGIRAGTKGVHSCGLPTAYWGSIYGKDLYLGGDTHNTAAGSIIFSEKLDSQRNGFKIAPVHATSANRVNLVFYRSNNGNSPWAANWTTFMTLSYDGKVTIAGSLTTSGDQVISSDAALKKHIKDLNLTVEQIAQLPAVTFDWKDGRGSSFGTVAQSVLPIFPQAVRGEEGNYSVVYGQGGWVFGVKNARAIVDIQKHETEQDKEIRELNIKVKEQAGEISRLKELLKMN